MLEQLIVEGGHTYNLDPNKTYDRCYIKGYDKSKIVIHGNGAKSHGIKISHTHGPILIRDLNIISGEDDSWRKGGIHLQECSRVTITDCAFRGFDAVAISGGGAKIQIKNCKIERTQAGIFLGGSNNWIYNNYIYRPMRRTDGQHDYIRIFGNDIVVNKNMCLGAQQSEVGDSHVDCIQSFDNESPLENVLITDNTFSDAHHGIILQGFRNKGMQRINITGNVFLNLWASGCLLNGVDHVNVTRNVFHNITHYGIYLSDYSSSGFLLDNIMTDVNRKYMLSSTFLGEIHG